MKYLALTIGPIYKTMSQARKTRELWSASFSFSLLMKYLIDEFSKHGELLSPSPNVKLPLHGAGVYPDRCYIKLNKAMTETEINNNKEIALKEFSLATGYNPNELAYFQIYVVQKEIACNPIKSLNVILDGLELSKKYFSIKTFDINYYWNTQSVSPEFFQNLYEKGYGDDEILPPILVKYSGAKSKTFKRFKSIPEISTTELEKQHPSEYWNALGIQYLKTSNGEINFEQLAQNKEDEQIEDNIINALKSEFKDNFKFRHKYFTIVQADGDNVGSLIGEIEKNNGDIMSFSNALNEFVSSAAGELKKYGAFPIYMGGDDLLFFAPLTNDKYEFEGLDFRELFPPEKNEKYRVNGNNVFFLMTRLNFMFKEKLAPIVNKYMKDKTVSLSFGLSVGYYKKPMNEILAESYELLFYNAKKQPCKNYIALKLEKHSGQSLDFGFTQNTPLYYYFLNLCTESKGKDENFLNSVMFKINNQKKIIIELANDVNKLKYFFDENFNEASHKNYQAFFEAVRHIIHETFSWFAHEKPVDENHEDKRISRIYSCLRFVQFLNANDNHE